MLMNRSARCMGAASLVLPDVIASSSPEQKLLRHFDDFSNHLQVQSFFLLSTQSHTKKTFLLLQTFHWKKGAL